MPRQLSVSIFGSGYVGCVSAACLAGDGVRVVAVDPDAAKIELLRRGRSPIHEPGLGKLIAEARANGTLTATSDFRRAVSETDVSFCCVGTPSREDGSLDTSAVRLVAEQIGAALAAKAEFHVVVVRSTVLPGTVESIVVPSLEAASGKKAGIGFGIAYYPEFLREGTAIADYRAPGAIVFGAYPGDERSIGTLRELCAALPVEPHVIPIRAAEIVKYANNCWHATKISFANEIGNLCKAAGIDSHQVMDVVCADTRLNISKAYMRPGFAFGGSCLPKDLRALRGFGRANNVATPMLDATVQANEHQMEKAFRLVKRTGEQKIGIVGITFKADTDDVRESPLVILAERLLGTGHEIAIYDPNVGPTDDGGRTTIPHLAKYMRSDVRAVLGESRTIVIGNRDEASIEAIEALDDQVSVVDLARMPLNGRNLRYEGICW
jgi:GDP-mannose 6-dehydrogenase